jgi:hypothetical protein
MYDSFMLGCLPVIIADDMELPFEHLLSYRSFSVKIMESQIAQLKEILLAIPDFAIRQMQQQLSRVWKAFSWQRPTESGDAFHAVLASLALKLRETKPVGPVAFPVYLNATAAAAAAAADLSSSVAAAAAAAAARRTPRRVRANQYAEVLRHHRAPTEPV